jgi:heme A synthase
LRVRLTRICLLMALQGVLGIVQYRLKLPAEIVWVHVATATLLWVGIVLAAMQAGSPVRERVSQVAAADEGALSAGGAPAQVVRS